MAVSVLLLVQRMRYYLPVCRNPAATGLFQGVAQHAVEHVAVRIADGEHRRMEAKAQYLLVGVGMVDAALEHVDELPSVKVQHAKRPNIRNARQRQLRQSIGIAVRLQVSILVSIA